MISLRVVHCITRIFWFIRIDWSIWKYMKMTENEWKREDEIYWVESYLEENILKCSTHENTWTWMKMHGNETTKLKLKKKCTLRDKWNTYDPPRRGLFLRWWSLLQASCLLSASLCFRLRLAPRAIIIFITSICVCFTIHFGMVGDTVLNCCVVLSAIICPSRVGVVPFASLAIDELLPIFKRNISTKL